MQCPSCNTNLREGSPVCPGCGIRVQTSAAGSDTYNTSTTSLARRIRRNLYAIEAIELGGVAMLLGVLFGIVGELVSPKPLANVGLFLGALFVVMVGAVAVALFLWGVYLLYIRVARAGGQAVDIGLWLLIALVTSSFTFWCWTLLDINRLIISKLFYRGEAPVEYAWSHGSKQCRKEWEQARKAAAEAAEQRARAAKEQPLPPDIEQLLQDLQGGLPYTRREAAEKIGVSTVSNRRVVSALQATQATDNDLGVRNAAAQALLAPVHQAVLQQYMSQPSGADTA